MDHQTSDTPTYYGVYARRNGETICEAATIGRGVDWAWAQSLAREMREEHPDADVWIASGLSLTGPAYETLSVLARDIRRGDEIRLHRYSRSAACDAIPTVRGSVYVALTNRGDAYLPAEQVVSVRRLVGSRPCATG